MDENRIFKRRTSAQNTSGMGTCSCARNSLQSACIWGLQCHSCRASRECNSTPAHSKYFYGYKTIKWGNFNANFVAKFQIAKWSRNFLPCFFLIFCNFPTSLAALQSKKEWHRRHTIYPLIYTAYQNDRGQDRTGDLVLTSKNTERISRTWFVDCSRSARLTPNARSSHAQAPCHMSSDLKDGAQALKMKKMKNCWRRRRFFFLVYSLLVNKYSLDDSVPHRSITQAAEKFRVLEFLLTKINLIFIFLFLFGSTS